MENDKRDELGKMAFDVAFNHLRELGNRAEPGWDQITEEAREGYRRIGVSLWQHGVFSRVDGFKLFCQEQGKWSQATFGSDQERGPSGPLQHLGKEVVEALSELGVKAEFTVKHIDPSKTVFNSSGAQDEIVDCLFLTIDAARRAGMDPARLVMKAFDKLEINKKRRWPAPSDGPVEHIREMGV